VAAVLHKGAQFPAAHFCCSCPWCSSMDDIRAQLDALMGQHRDVPLSERDKYK
jgi:hypothetical protein